jgi:hypothetical protein
MDNFFVIVVKLESEAFNYVEQVGTQTIIMFLLILPLGCDQAVAYRHQNRVNDLYKKSLLVHFLQSNWSSALRSCG